MNVATLVAHRGPSHEELPASLKKNHHKSSSVSSDEDLVIYPLNVDDFSEIASKRDAERTKSVPTFTVSNHRRNGGRNVVATRWRHVAHKAMNCEDPWQTRKITSLPTDSCQRYRYLTVCKKWVIDKVLVKMEPVPFDRGAMRECYRLKKLSASSSTSEKDWEKAMNYVAKRYVADVERCVYFEDVRLQMDAKLWSEEYNRHNPPKKVDIFQVSLLEFIERDGTPLFHLEHYIEGEYVKYNSNSGFVSSLCRQTPQTFSHFTFERSGHQMIVVDIQGVGDLYTDPQIHTFNAQGYGDGNLGTRGMALFFHSHVCNSICRTLGLSSFDLAPSEKAFLRKRLSRTLSKSETVCRGFNVELCLPSGESIDAMDLVRSRSRSSVYSLGEQSSSSAPLSPVEFPGEGVCASDTDNNGSERSDSRSTGTDDDRLSLVPLARKRCDTELDSSICIEAEEDANFWKEARKLRRSTCVTEEIQLVNKENRFSILAQVHLDLCRYHELGRFVEEGQNYDRAAAWFHLEMAAKCGNGEAILTVAKIYLNIPRELLRDFVVDNDEESIDRGLDWMESAANSGDSSAIMYMAEAYAQGTNLGTTRHRSFMKAAKFYDRLLLKEDVDSGLPRYEIYKRLAEMYAVGDDRLPQDVAKASELYNEAGNVATEAMKGKMASKFFMLAEQVLTVAEE